MGTLNMNKVELAKMLGLSHPYGGEVVEKWHIEEVLKQDWYLTHTSKFNAHITVEITQEDFYEENLDIRSVDLKKEEDIKVCIKQCEDLLWKRAADQYLEKIRNLVETIKV